ncbi:guanosine-5'-triphosphate,3'-diphosphate pyrophosphatase [Aliidiomarina taiwanensis]|uniref:Guanosine-5'-triphosphate,3'-diphosphate pyrophosphatase n=2 Tax=Aliidiomarina taiwanensis TaxID=946228 RepID=A0A432X0V4_9GAMM|nr:guanosine-5'-triphosphate,3'-diphosphate pyrophosphatase [Aliidiomarina taiwanensis]
MRSNQYYAAIDLGSNSFHMLIVRVVAGSVRTIAKIKRRIRLAEGIRADGTLTPEAERRALECLAIFADRVSDISPKNIRAVGTATLRKINPDDPILERMQQVLGHPIEIISGLAEAETIYQGVAHTSSSHKQLMVCDIGGASTEVALGEGFQPKQLISMDMGCVAWMTRFFPEGRISPSKVAQAIAAAEQLVTPHAANFAYASRPHVVGASGTFKALQEIAIHRGLSQRFKLPWLETLVAELSQYENLTDIQLKGLKPERALVLLPGLCILVALFRQLRLSYVEATEAALREGVLYSMLSDLQHHDVQLRTLTSLAQHYQVDTEQSQRVLNIFAQLTACPSVQQHLPPSASTLARAVAYLHEIGHSLSYKHAGQHNHYVLKNTPLPGFTLRQRHHLLELLTAIVGIIDDDIMPTELPVSPKHALLSRVLRISILCCQRRRDDTVPQCRLTSNLAAPPLLKLHLPANFASQNPFLTSLLNEESRFQQSFGGLLIS